MFRQHAGPAPGPRFHRAGEQGGVLGKLLAAVLVAGSHRSLRDACLYMRAAVLFLASPPDAIMVLLR